MGKFQEAIAKLRDTQDRCSVLGERVVYFEQLAEVRYKALSGYYNVIKRVCDSKPSESRDFFLNNLNEVYTLFSFLDYLTLKLNTAETFNTHILEENKKILEKVGELEKENLHLYKQIGEKL